jgi:hypothetical protein
MVVLPIDPKLASCGWPVFINSETLKKASKGLMGTLYELTLKDDSYYPFEVPAVNGKAAQALGAMEIAIGQQEEAAAFKAFFKTWYDK